MTIAATPRAAARRAPHTIDPERARFYDLLWGSAEGYAYVVAGLPGSEIEALGWPLGPDESADPDKVMLLVWSRATFDTFKAAGRPHTGKVFAWPREARALDRYAERLGAEGYNVYTRKYLGATEQAAKYGEAPATAAIVVVEDAPADPAPWGPAYSFTLETSEYSRQGFYRLARPLPWATVRELAERAGLRLQADSGGPNPAQLTRVPTFRNTKRKANRFRVRLVEGAGEVAPAELARAYGLDLAAPRGSGERRAGDNSQLSRAPGDLSGDAEAEPWRSRATRDALDAEAALWRPLMHNRRGGLLDPSTGAPRGFKKPLPLDIWRGPGTGDGSRDLYNTLKSVLMHGYGDGEALALVEYWAHTFRPDYAAKRGAAGVWVDLCRVLFKVCAELGERRSIRTAKPPAGVAPVPGPELARRRPGRPAGARVSNVERLADELRRRLGEHTTRGDLAGALDLTPRSITTHMRALAQADRLDVLPGPRGFTVLRVENKSCKASTPAAPASAQQDAANPAEGGKESESAEGGNYAPSEASQCGADSGGITPAPLPPSPPAAAAPSPAPERCADAAPVPSHNARALDAEALAALVAQIDEAAGFIRLQTWERKITRGPRAGLVETVTPRATLDAVAEQLPEVAPADLAAAWAWRKSWGREVARLHTVEASAELYKELRATLDALALADKPAPLPWAELDPQERQRLAARKLGRADGDDRRAAALAEVQQGQAIRAHRTAVQRRKRNEVLRDLVCKELRRRGLPLTPPTGRDAVGKRGKAPARSDVARAEAEQHAECMAALDRLYTRAQASTPARPVVELDRPQFEAAPATPAPAPDRLDLDAERMAAARRRLVERARRGESLVLPPKVADCAD